MQTILKVLILHRVANVYSLWETRNALQNEMTETYCFIVYYVFL